MSQKKKTTAQSKRPRKAPSNQTGGTAWGKKVAAAISGKMQSADMKKLILLNFPYIIAFYMVEKAAWLYRHCNGDTIVDRLMVLFMNFGLAYKSYLPSVHPFDLLVGLIGAAALKAVIYFKGKNAKKYRQGEEYGSARWGNAKDIEPFIDPVFENNVLFTQTERLMMSGRPKHPKYARNKNVIVIGGSGSGKTRFFVKPNLMQMPEKVSYVCTDPKGTIIIECGKMLSDAGYKIKVLNTINFKKSMHYNPFHYIRSEKDILKLVNTIIANTKGDGEKSGEDFWVKAERLLYCALIGYIYYEAPEEEQNFSTLLEFINASEAREDDEEFKNPVDELFEDLEKAKPEHFAVRQYKKYKLAAGVVCSKRLLNQAVGKSLRTHNLKPKKGAQVMRKNEKITALYERLSRDDFGKDDDQQRESNSISNQKAMLEEFAEHQGKKKSHSDHAQSLLKFRILPGIQVLEIMECFLQRHLPAAEFSRNIVDNADRIQVRTATRNPLNYSHGILLGIVQCDHDSGGRHIGLCRLKAGDSQHPLDRVLDPVNLRPVLEHQLPGQGRCVQIQFIIFLFLHFFPL